MSREIALPAAPGQRMETRDRAGMLVATKTCTVKGEDGMPERLKAGQTRVVTGHWLAQTYPDLFAADQAERARPRAAPSDVSSLEADELKRELQIRRQTIASAPPPAVAPPKPETWTPLVRLNTSAPPSFTVKLSSNARRLIGDLAYAARGEHETGGALFGPPARAAQDTAEVWIAGEPGSRARASRFSMEVDLDHIRREAGGLERAGSDARWVGHWHSHPGGNGEPSPADLNFFAADCRELTLTGQKLTHYVALILTPSWDHDLRHERYLSWASPTIYAWHVHALSDDQFSCRRAKLVDPGQSQEGRRWRL